MANCSSSGDVQHFETVWTSGGAPLQIGSPVKPIHITDLKNAINAWMTAFGKTVGQVTRTPGDNVEAADFNAIRDGIDAVLSNVTGCTAYSLTVPAAKSIGDKVEAASIQALAAAINSFQLKCSGCHIGTAGHNYGTQSIGGTSCQCDAGTSYTYCLGGDNQHCIGYDSGDCGGCYGEIIPCVNTPCCNEPDHQAVCSSGYGSTYYCSCDVVTGCVKCYSGTFNYGYGVVP